MNREIKLRCWDKRKRCWLQDLSWNTTPANVSEYQGMLEFHNDEYFEWIDFTGLKDKNGKDIYKFDYLFDGKRIHLVTFSITEYWTGFDFGELQNITKYCEIIGNQFQNDYWTLEEKYLNKEVK